MRLKEKILEYLKKANCVVPSDQISFDLREDPQKVAAKLCELLNNGKVLKRACPETNKVSEWWLKGRESEIIALPDLKPPKYNKFKRRGM